MYKENPKDRWYGIFAKSLAITQGIWYNICHEEIDGGTMQLARNIVRSVTDVAVKSSFFSRNLPFPAFFTELACRRHDGQFAVFPQNSG